MTENPLLANLKLPGKIFQLPSRGLFYDPDVFSSDVENAEILVNAMSAFDEIVIKNPDLLFSGKALNEVVKACIPNILKAGELYGKDVDAIMIFLRMVTYGPQYEINVTHDCENAKSHSYIIDLDQLISRMKYLDATTFNDKYKVILPNGQTVHLQPVKYKNVIELLQDNQNKKELTADDLKKNLEKSIMDIIKDIDNITDKNLIYQWVKKAPAPYIEKIADAIQDTNDWGPDNIIEVKCKDCGETFKVELPINPISFF